MNDLPISRLASLRVLHSIIQIEDIAAAPFRHSFHYLVDLWIRFHRALLEGEDIPIEVFKKWKLLPDVTELQFVRI